MSNQQISIKFPDGSKKEYPKGILASEVAKSISNSLFKEAIVCRVNGTLVDLTYPIHQDSELSFYNINTAEGIEVIRHSTAHILAQAIKRIYPNALLSIGPVIENGFYYDIDLDQSISESDLSKIEKEMKKIQKENLTFIRSEVSYEEAKNVFKDNSYKVNIIESHKEEQLSIYQQGEFTDLCTGPHVPSTKYVNHFKLTKVAGAYWKGDSNNKMLQRIYGVAFASKEELDNYFDFLKEADERNHRKLGKQLKLFMFSEEAPGMPFYLPNGQFIKNKMEEFLRQIQLERGYQEVKTPLMMNQRLWEASGHWDHYHENMYFTKVDDNDFALKPMNCPGHMLIFKNELKSYKDLPLRIAEFGQVHRHEFSGALNGLLRVRTFCQDDAHIFIMKSQIQEEVKNVLELIDYLYNIFGFEYSIELSTRPEKYLGELSLWEEAEKSLSNVLDNLNLPYSINEGDGAFYGPKIDIHIKDALNRSHQCATVQLDFQMPEKFDLTYVNENNEKERPVVIHRAIFGSLDRFFGILIEHFKGAFPLWMAPTQVNLIGVSENNIEYVKQIQKVFAQENIRVNIDNRDEKLGKKIRESQMNKIPYTIVVGDEEQNNNSLSVRKYGQSENVSKDITTFIKELKKEINSKELLV
ncbi:threonine--tRNA ligase [Macrococcoides caseolyticum]|uniref:threonine--tRNA ligase n=1 Tax=Macrococcoides caseolyticum TaxID=69966 RepID=UPI000C32BD67|nr:threonine--tRNA ligase [Macrococcus caseolyticus]PKE09909.1 threonine--tRNA ligase [Macrococcus caseolyticus]PKE46627.1 threonine--tRNA ligase [Macrococcus caseolyticus]PKF13056.1 threonine--tRNA ligase [Macrococcus caseolyticus]TDM22175.1 threonine--tRNA ligase [Macrococcus caseolyticus]